MNYEPSLISVGNFNLLGWKSAPYFCNFSVLDIALFSTTDSKIIIYGTNDSNKYNNSIVNNSVILYEQDIPSNTSYKKSISPIYPYIIIEVINVNQIVNEFLYFQGYPSKIKNFTSQTFLDGVVSNQDSAILSRSASDYKTELIQNNFDFSKNVNIFGISTSNNLGQPYVLGFNNLGSPLYSDIPLEFYIECDSNNDIFGGTGAQIVLVSYIDSNYKEATVEINCNNFINTGIFGFSVNEIRVIQTGNNLENLGNIKIVNANQTILYCIVRPTQNISQCLNYQVPINNSLIIKKINLNGVSSGSKLLLQEYQVQNNITLTLRTYYINSSNLFQSIPLNIKINEKNKIMVQVVSSVLELESEMIQFELESELIQTKKTY